MLDNQFHVTRWERVSDEKYRSCIEHNFCSVAQTELDNLSLDNVRADDWINNTSSLLYAISRGRFDSPGGIFQIVNEGSNEQIVSLAGAYVANFDPRVALLGSRAWTLPEFRTRFIIGNLILPDQFDWAISAGCSVAMLTFNPHNAWLAKMILRATLGRMLRPGMQNSPIYQNWVCHPTLCRIQNTDQIVLYKQLGVEEVKPDLIDTGVPCGIDDK